MTGEREPMRAPTPDSGKSLTRQQHDGNRGGESSKSQGQREVPKYTEIKGDGFLMLRDESGQKAPELKMVKIAAGDNVGTYEPIQKAPEGYRWVETADRKWWLLPLQQESKES